jgi:hypothetical protein
MFRSKSWMPVSVLLAGAMTLNACAPQPAVTTVEVTRMVEGTPQTVVITATPASQVAAGSIQINGAGATFPLPIYTE